MFQGKTSISYKSIHSVTDLLSVYLIVTEHLFLIGTPFILWCQYHLCLVTIYSMTFQLYTLVMSDNKMFCDIHIKGNYISGTLGHNYLEVVSNLHTLVTQQDV